MRTILGVILSLIGAGFILYGLGNALMELSSLYQGALNDPMNQAEGAEKAISNNMIRHLTTGAIGAPFLIVGSVLLRSSAMRRRRLRKQGAR